MAAPPPDRRLFTPKNKLRIGAVGVGFRVLPDVGERGAGIGAGAAGLGLRPLAPPPCGNPKADTGVKICLARGMGDGVRFPRPGEGAAAPVGVDTSFDFCLFDPPRADFGVESEVLESLKERREEALIDLRCTDES